MRIYPCTVVGVNVEGRAQYIAEHVRPGDEIELRREPDTPHDPASVSAWHRGTAVGYIPRNKPWVSRSLDEGDDLIAVVVELNVDQEDKLSGISIDVTIIDDGQGGATASPAPFIAPISKRDTSPSPSIELSSETPEKRGFGSLVLLAILVVSAIAAAILVGYVGNG